MSAEQTFALLARVPLGPVGDALGGRLLEFDGATGTAVLEFRPGPLHTNLWGTVHGGIVTAMLDLCTAVAGIGASGMTQSCPTIEMAQRFLKPVPVGRVLARGRAVQLGRTIAYLEGAILSPAGEVLATGTVTSRALARDWATALALPPGGRHEVTGG
ncbi:MAG: PaaI family thioesterase [Burkholderiales bacterium]|nr:PaaI family thioesterase [Burkholderiales bacterium]